MKEDFRSLRAIVLRRVNFGEADRIITVLTPEGKRSVMAKGVRRMKSKLAAGIELLSENELTLLSGKSELFTLISARPVEPWPQLLADYDRLQLAYELLKYLDRSTEEHAGGELYEALRTALASLNRADTALALIELWLYLTVLRLTGHQPDLSLDAGHQPLQAERLYELDPAHGVLLPGEEGRLAADHIKLWRVCMANELDVITGIGGAAQAATESIDSLRSFIRHQHG
jgi:DNA repair protein RecO (recombination protein O)